MPELIERHALLKKVYEHPQERERMTDGEWCRKCIYEAPKVEAEPVRRGRWKTKVIHDTFCFQCSACNSTYKGDTNYCPHCGARMNVRTYERRCESCIHFVQFPESEVFDLCKIQGYYYEIYRDLPYDKCTGFAPRGDNNANN